MGVPPATRRPRAIFLDSPEGSASRMETMAAWSQWRAAALLQDVLLHGAFACSPTSFLSPPSVGPPSPPPNPPPPGIHLPPFPPRPRTTPQPPPPTLRTPHFPTPRRPTTPPTPPAPP